MTAFQGEDIQQLQSQGGRKGQDILEEFRWICGQSTERGEVGLKRKSSHILRKQLTDESAPNMFYICLSRFLCDGITSI